MSTVDTDRELLLLAAKAAGLEIESWTTYGPYVGGLEGCIWSPLTDDGDAFRLAVKLRMTINPCTEGVFVSRYEGEPVITEPFDEPGCEIEATRLAVFRFAAEIGRSME